MLLRIALITLTGQLILLYLYKRFISINRVVPKSVSILRNRLKLISLNEWGLFDIIWSAFFVKQHGFKFIFIILS